MNRAPNERGQALILVALAAVGLFAFAALAIDGSRAFSDRRHAQNAADTAALAGSLAYTRGGDATAAALARALSNGYDGLTSNNVSVTITDTPAGACPGTGKDVTVDIVSDVPTTLARVIGRREVTNAVTSTARACDVNVSGGEPLYSGASVFATKTEACGNGITDKAIYMQGSSHLQTWGGGMGSASTDGNCLYFKGGETQFKLSETSPKVCADIFTASSSGGTFNSVRQEDGCGNIHRDQTFEPPPPDLGITCPVAAQQTGNTLSPGNWSGAFPPAGVTTLQPGTYCVNGAFILNGGQKLTGNGVTIVMNSGNLHWNGDSEVKLSAPSSGNYEGLLIYFPPGNSSDVDVNGNSNATITGTILAQNSDCFFAGSGQLQKQVLQFICYTWGMDGSGQAELMYDSSLFYSPVKVTNPAISVLK